MELALKSASALADTIHLVWPSPDNMFPYWHMCDVQLSRELRHVHMTHGVGVGAFLCLAVEATGHQVKVVAQQSGWEPDTFLGKLFASLEMSFASVHDVLGIRASGEGTGEEKVFRIATGIVPPHLWCVTKVPVRKPPLRQETSSNPPTC